MTSVLCSTPHCFERRAVDGKCLQCAPADALGRHMAGVATPAIEGLTWQCSAPNCNCPKACPGECAGELHAGALHEDAQKQASLTAQNRKQRPVYSGVLRYFPEALMAVAHCSWTGNEQHNAGQPLHWNRAKSTDEADALVRHLLQAGTVDTDGVRHTAKVAWRALALLQKELEAAGETL